MLKNRDKNNVRDRMTSGEPPMLIESFNDARLRQLGQRMTILERLDLYIPEAWDKAAVSILTKWTSDDSPKRNGWSTFPSVEEELQGLEAEGVISAEKAQELR